MWNWFQPRCPLDTQEKVWVESRMGWLVGQLGSQRMLEARVIEPTDEFFPGEYRGTEKDAARIFRRLVGYMQIDPAEVQLIVRTDWGEGNYLGQYLQGETATIYLNPSQLSDTEALVGTLAHELAHHILLGGGHLQDNNEDLERLTDLLPIFLGVGIFEANAKFRDKTVREGRFSWYSARKQGYLPMRMHAYALALFAFARDELQPSWAMHLRLDIAEPMRKGLRFLAKGGDSTFDLSDSSGDAEAPTVEDCVPRLASNSASRRFLALVDLIELGRVAAPAVHAIAERLHDRDGDVACLAADALGAIGPPAGVCAGQLLDMLHSRKWPHRERAAYALGAIRAHDANVVNDLVRKLDDEVPEVAGAIAYALGQCAAGNETVAQHLLPLYHRALKTCDDRLIHPAATAIHQTAADPAKLVREYFEPMGADLCGFATDCLAEAAEKAKAEGAEARDGRAG
jgi:hypothetical protein